MDIPQITLENDTHVLNFTTGKIYRKLANDNSEQKSVRLKETGLSKPHGYHQNLLNGKTTYVHKYLFENYYGVKIPNDKVIDHVDRNKTNNKINNLRLVSRQQNQQTELNKKIIRLVSKVFLTTNVIKSG